MRLALGHDPLVDGADNGLVLRDLLRDGLAFGVIGVVGRALDDLASRPDIGLLGLDEGVDVLAGESLLRGGFLVGVHGLLCRSAS